jgi:hypothetical protein
MPAFDLMIALKRNGRGNWDAEPAQGMLQGQEMGTPGALVQLVQRCEHVSCSRVNSVSVSIAFVLVAATNYEAERETLTDTRPDPPPLHSCP